MTEQYFGNDVKLYIIMFFFVNQIVLKNVFEEEYNFGMYLPKYLTKCVLRIWYKLIV